MCSNGLINSTEVAVLCLLQKIMSDYAGAQKNDYKDSCQGKSFKSLPQNYYYTILRVTSSSNPAFWSQQPLPKLQNINYYKIV